MIKNEEFAQSENNASQDGNRSWWQSHPMTYDWEGLRSIAEGLGSGIKRLMRNFGKLAVSLPTQTTPRYLLFRI